MSDIEELLKLIEEETERTARHEYTEPLRDYWYAVAQLEECERIDQERKQPPDNITIGWRREVDRLRPIAEEIAIEIGQQLDDRDRINFYKSRPATGGGV